MKYKLYSLLISLSLVSVSCTESFLKLEPNNSVVVDKFFKTAEDFNLATIACYSKLQGQVNFYTECCEYRSDNLFLSAPTSGTQDRYDIDQFKDTPANGLLKDFWANFYNGIYRCNMVLDRIDDAEFDEELRKQYKGEALFIRAFTYFNLYRTWGGVQVTLKAVTPAEALTIKRSTNEEMFTYITNDLELILKENLLPESYSQDDLGRVTAGAARTLLGKVYLTFHQWDKARDVLRDVIGKYALTKAPGDVFDVDNKMNEEIIFAIRFNKEVVGEGHGLWHTNSSSDINSSSQTTELRNCYTGNDLRRELVTLVPTGNVYIIKKFYDTQHSTTNNAGNDQIILRYADALLMYAEALNEIAYDGSASSVALQSLNEVRERAGLTGLTATDVPNQSSFRKAILEERQKEFPYEGHRWFDMVRMGYAKEIMAQQGYNLQDHQLVYPIPTTELDRIGNTDILWQNPGY